MNKGFLYMLSAPLPSSLKERKKKNGRRKHNECGDGEAEGVAGIIRELWWVFEGRVGEGVSGRFEGREGSSLDTSRYTFSHSGCSPSSFVLLCKLLLPLLLWERRGAEDDESSW